MCMLTPRSQRCWMSFSRQPTLRPRHPGRSALLFTHLLDIYQLHSVCFSRSAALQRSRNIVLGCSVAAPIQSETQQGSATRLAGGPESVHTAGGILRRQGEDASDCVAITEPSHRATEGEAAREESRFRGRAELCKRAQGHCRLASRLDATASSPSAVGVLVYISTALERLCTDVCNERNACGNATRHGNTYRAKATY